MNIPGQSIRVPKIILGDLCVLRLEVDAILPDFDPHEPVLSLETVRHLDHLQQLANEGRLDELQQQGVVYVRRSA